MSIIHFPNKASHQLLIHENESVVVNSSIEPIPSTFGEFGLIDCYALPIHFQGLAFEESQLTLAESGCGKVGPEMGDNGRLKSWD